MNFVLHKHNRPSHQIPLPPGLRELMTDISREVLRDQPPKITDYIADYLDALLVVRENTYIAKHTLDDAIQFTMDMIDLMEMAGMSEQTARAAANYLRGELQKFTEVGCVTEFSEKVIISKLIYEFGLDCTKAAKVKQIIEESFKGYFYRYISYRDAKHGIFGVTWQQAVERTLNVYRMNKPEQSAIDRAAIVIQAAYRGFYERKVMVKKRMLNKAAVVIQKVYRGFETRKRISLIKESAMLNRQSSQLSLAAALKIWPPPYENIDGVSLDYSHFSFK